MLQTTVARPSRSRWPTLGAILLVLLIGCGSPPEGTVVVAPTDTVSSTSRPSSAPTSPPTSTPTLSPSPLPTEDPIAQLQQTQANELGWIMVWSYHLIEEPEDRWSRTPANFRRDVERFIAEGYYPINLRDLALGVIDVPAGKTPVVLTFDDSSSGQFRYLSDGTVDPDCAVGILQDAARRHPQDWRLRATFFVLLDVDVADRVLFGQPEWAEQKLRDLVEWGMEIGSHTISHFNLAEGSPEKARWQLAVSEETLEAMVPGYEIHSLSVPLGLYPEDEELIKAGEWEGQHYDFLAVVEVVGGASPSPFSIKFNPYHILRIQAIEDELEWWLPFFQENPQLRYISDGDPTKVSIPDSVDPLLEGTLREDLPAGLFLQRYPLSNN